MVSIRLAIVAILSLTGTNAARAAASPTEIILPFYETEGLELDPKVRGNFVDPAKTVLDHRDVLMQSGQGDCLDINMALDNVPFDRAQVKTTLKTKEVIRDTEAKVIVGFMIDATPHRLEWKFKQIDGVWKINDLWSVSNEWALSQYGCD